MKDAGEEWPHPAIENQGLRQPPDPDVNVVGRPVKLNELLGQLRVIEDSGQFVLVARLR